MQRISTKEIISTQAPSKQQSSKQTTAKLITPKDGRVHVESFQVAEQDFVIRIVKGEHQGKAFALQSGTTIIGASSECQIQLDDDGASRRHCQIDRGEHALQIKDLGSTNGTWVDGVAVGSAYLQPGARIRIGHTLLVLDIAYAPLGDSSDKPAHYGFRGMVGRTPAIMKLFSSRDRLAHSDVTILVQGETGTGKSALARSIHMASHRRDAPFVVFDCAAVSPNLVESALFGHEKGAFTGADTAKVGALEAAGKGTLFIDELTDLSATLQPKLLRALEEREFTPVGTTKQKAVGCRIIAASQQDVRLLVEAGKFRRDLYYRLAVVVVPLPPLRERIDDIPLIVDHLLYSLDQSITPFAQLPKKLQQIMLKHSWPGNIRELRNYLERLMVGRKNALLSDLEDDEIPLPEETDSVDGDVTLPATGGLKATAIRWDIPFRDVKAALIEDFEKSYLEKLLLRSEFNIAEAARVSGINRRHLHDMLLRYGLDKKTLLAKNSSP